MQFRDLAIKTRNGSQIAFQVGEAEDFLDADGGAYEMANHGGPVGWIEWVESKSPGDATALIKSAVSKMERMGVQAIGLAVAPVRADVDPSRLAGLYRRLGFKKVAESYAGAPIMVRFGRGYTSAHAVSAERWRQTSSERKRQERQTERNKRFRKVPIKITQQPTKKRGVYMGRVTYEWKSGPKRGQKTSIPVTLKEPAKLTIKGKDLMVKPRDGEMYVWGDKDAEKEPGTDSKGNPIRKGGSGKAREKRLRDQLKEKYEALIAERGPLEAGKAMAKGFVVAHNKLKGKTSKRALAKVYGVVLKTNKAAHRSFGRAVKQSKSMTARKPKTEAAVMASSKIRVGDIVQHVLTDAFFKVVKIRGQEAEVESQNYLETKLKHSFPVKDLKKADKHIPLEGGVMDTKDKKQVIAALRAAADILDPQPVVFGMVLTARGDPKVLSDEEFASWDNHAEKVRKLLFAHRDKAGQLVKVRLDIKESGKQKKLGRQGVVTIHQSPATQVQPGKVVGYDHSAVVKDALFVVGGLGAHKVGLQITKKFPFAYTMGKLSNEPARPQGVPVRYNPHREHLFLDARTLAPLRGAKKIIHIGAATYAVGPDYFGPGEAPPPPEGFKSAAKPPEGLYAGGVTA